MPVVEIPDKQMVVEFPDTMSFPDIEKAILADVYGKKSTASTDIITDVPETKPQNKYKPDDFGFAISTITGEPIPTAEEKFRQSDFITKAPATAAGIVTSVPTGIAAGYVGLLRLASTGDLDKTKAMMDEINAQPAKFIKTPEQQKVVENISRALMYLPEKGKELAGKIADAELQRLSPENQKRLGIIKPAMETAGEFGVLAAFPLLKRAVAKSTWFRMLSNEERGLVVQSLDDVLKNNLNMTEGEILRKWDNPNFKREALAKRMKTEVASEPEAMQETPAPEAKTTPQPTFKPTGLPISDLQKAIAKEAITETLAKNGMTPETFLQTNSLGRESSQNVLPDATDTSSVEAAQTVPGQDLIQREYRGRQKQIDALYEEERLANARRERLTDLLDEVEKPKSAEEIKDAEEAQIALGLMADEIRNTSGAERGTLGGDTAHIIGSSHPDWFQNLNSLIKREGKLSKGISKDDFFTVLNKIESGGEKSLTNRQSEIYQFMKRAVPEFKAQSEDFAATAELKWMQDNGYEPLGRKEVVAAELNEGDKVLIKQEEFEVKGMTPDGNVRLEDGVPVEVDAFDKITIEGIKKAPVPQKPTDEVRKQFEDAVKAAGGTLDGEYPGTNAWSVTDGVTKSSFMVRKPEDIAIKFTEARKTAEKAKTAKEPFRMTKDETWKDTSKWDINYTPTEEEIKNRMVGSEFFDEPISREQAVKEIKESNAYRQKEQIVKEYEPPTKSAFLTKETVDEISNILEAAKNGKIDTYQAEQMIYKNLPLPPEDVQGSGMIGDIYGGSIKDNLGYYFPEYLVGQNIQSYGLDGKLEYWPNRTWDEYQKIFGQGASKEEYERYSTGKPIIMGAENSGGVPAMGSGYFKEHPELWDKMISAFRKNPTKIIRDIHEDIKTRIDEDEATEKIFKGLYLSEAKDYSDSFVYEIPLDDYIKMAPITGVTKDRQIIRDEHGARMLHKMKVAEAYKEGKTIPDENLEYYGLKKKARFKSIPGGKPEMKKDETKGEIEALNPEGVTVDWSKEKVIEKDGLKGTYYATYNKDGSFKKWQTKTEIERLKNLKGTEGLNLKQDNYGKQDGITGKETKGKQSSLGLEVEDKNQPSMFSKKPPSGKSEYSIGDYSNTPIVMQMPELIQLFKDVSGGKYPQIAKIIKAKGMSAAGVFNSGTGGIKLQKDIFDNPQEAAKIFAHEIGHWIDWLPDKAINRGNLLGRIASLKHYFDTWLDDILGGKGRLTDADKKYFKNEAKKLAGGEKWIDEVITKTIPITPEDVLDIWNSGMPREALHPELLDYIQRLGTAEKKAIVLSAMKGMVADEIKNLARIVKEQTGKKIKASDQEVLDKYNELVSEELKKRNIYNLNEIRNEAQRFSQSWRPFDPAEDPKYTKYRYSGKELYADALSGILTNPDVFRATAPKFWSAWYSWIHRKPELKAAWETWQGKIKAGEVELTKERMSNVYDMFEKNDKARIDALMKEREGSVISAYDGLMTYFWDKNHKALGLLNSLEKEGGLTGEHAENTRYLIEEANYIASEISVYVGDIYKQIMNPLEAEGHDAKELGLVLFQRRVLGDRSKIGNPLGHSPETTEVDIKNIENTIWGKEKSKAINDLANKLRTLRESFLFPIIEKAGLATPEFMQIIRDTKSYATFSNIDWFKNKYGTGPGAGFYRQIGTLGEIENPLVSMILKDISLIRAARINIAKRELAIDLFHARVLEPAKMRWSKDANGKVPVESTDSKQDLYSFLNQGKPEYYYASKKIVDMFRYAPVEAQQVATIWRHIAQPMRELLVSKNPIWMARNVFRDVRQTIKNIPEVTLKDIPKLLVEYKKAFAETVKDVYGKERSPAIRKMMNEKALPINRIWTAFDETIESELDRIGAELDFSRKQNLDAPTALKAVKFIWNNLDKAGRISEVWGKLAGYKYLKKYSDRGQKQISHVTRTRIGTPDYRRIGTGQQITNNVFLFSNVGKEGIRSAIESAVEDPGGYAWKTFWLNVMPKIAIAALGSGAVVWGLSKMGYDAEDDEDMKKIKTLQRVIEGISEYDKANYTIIPLGLTDKGKSAYLRIPEDYEGQFWGALAHKLMAGKFTGHEGLSNLTLEQQPYKLHPYIIAVNRLITYYVKGQNPVEEYSGRNIMTDATHTVGGWQATKAMGKSTWKELGLSLVYEPAWDGLEKSEASYEKALKTFPLNSLGTFLRFSDQGITEKIENELAVIKKGKALETIAFNEAFIKLANGEKLSGDEALSIMSKPTHQQKEKLLSLIGRKYGDAYLRQLTRPGLSKDEKVVIFSMMLKDRKPQEVKIP